jgi:uncharacterized protein (DUF924 family)
MGERKRSASEQRSKRTARVAAAKNHDLDFERKPVRLEFLFLCFKTKEKLPA